MQSKANLGLRLGDIEAVAERYDVPWLDVLMIAINAEGTRPHGSHTRVRMQLQPHGSDEVWQLILPLDNPESPFALDEEGIWLDGELVAALRHSENDDVVLTYLRADGRAITLNSHSRSQCTGCLFCPNVIEDASDATVSGVAELDNLLAWVRADNEWSDLAHAEVITVCSGCFQNPDAAVSHMTDLRVAASRHGFAGRLHLLSSVVRDRSDLERLAGEAGPFHLTLTLECFTRRSTLLKDTKASLRFNDAIRILDDCADLGILGDFTYVAGLDPWDEAASGLSTLAAHTSTFPRIQVFQAHNAFMRSARSPDAGQVEYHVRLREAIEAEYGSRDLAPRSWENYRPLWYSEFCGNPVAGPRV